MPVVGDLIGMGIETVLVGMLAVKWLGWTVYADRIMIARILESVVDKWRNDNQLWPGAIAIDQFDLSKGRRIGTRVIENKTRPSFDEAKVIGLQFVHVPSLDDSGPGGCDVNLPELREFGIIAPKHLEEDAPFVRVDNKRAYRTAHDHCLPDLDLV